MDVSFNRKISDHIRTVCDIIHPGDNLTIIDLKDYFHHIPISQESQIHLVAFVDDILNMERNTLITEVITKVVPSQRETVHRICGPDIAFSGNW